jgi:hypothetical protein
MLSPATATTGLMARQMLPQFLLPKLSWQGGFIGRQSVRTLTTTAATQASFRELVHQNRMAQSTSTTSLNAFDRKPRILECLPRSRSFHATTRQLRDHHFDTLKFVQRLKEEGFTEEQSVAMMKVLSDVIEERCIHLSLPF